MLDNYTLDGGNYSQEDVLLAAKAKGLTIEEYISKYYPEDSSTKVGAEVGKKVGASAADKGTPTRETSWLAGEEGWIPDSWQPNVKRPDVEIKPMQDWGGVKVVKGKGMFAGMEGQYIDDDSRQDLLTKADDIQHASAVELEQAIGDNYFNKEDKGAEYLTNYYRNEQGLGVKFIEAKVGYNQLKMVVDGVELDGEINLTKNTDWNDLQKNIQLKIEDQFGDKTKTATKDVALLDKITSAPNLQNILDFDLTGKNKAEFAHVLDKAFNPNQLPPKEERNVLDDYNYDEEKYGRRLSVESDQGFIMGAKSFIAETTSFGNYDINVADMDGGITLDDGTYVPYTYIWDKRKELQKMQTLNDDTILYDKKVEIHGGEDEFHQYIADNAWIYLDEPEEVEIRNKHIQLRDTEDEGARATIEAEINGLWKKLYPDLSDADIESLTLYDKDGKFIDIKKPESEDGEAEGIAREFGYDYIVKKRADKLIHLINLGKRVNTNKNKISEETNFAVKGIGSMLDFSNDRSSNDFAQLEAVSDYEDIFLGEPGEGLSSVSTMQGDIFAMEEGIPTPLSASLNVNKTLSELPGNSDLAKEYNEALRDFKTWSRAVDLNLNINQTSEENLLKEFVNNVTESFVGAKTFTEKDSDEARDAWRGILEHDGYGELQKDGTIKMPEHVIESSFFRNGSLGKNSTTRKLVEGGGEIIADLAPLLLELYVFKKLGGLKKLQTTFGTARRSGGLGSKVNVGLMGRFANKIDNPAAKWVTRNMVTPGLITTAEWAIAESAGELVTGGAWKAHTIDWAKGETNFTMPMTMGMSGAVFGKFSQSAKAWLGKTPMGNAILPKLQNPDGWLNRTRAGAAVKSYGPVIPSAMGQGATATTMLLVAETAQAVVDEAIKQKDFAFVERFKEITNTEHVISTWFAMTVLSGKDVAPKAREAFRTTVANLKRNTERTAEIHKELGTDENSSWGEINSAAKKKLEKVYDSGLSIKEINAKVKEVKEMSRELRLDKLIKSSKESAIADGKYYEEFVLPRWEVMRNLSTKPVNEWTVKDYDQIGGKNGMNHAEFYQVLRRSGIEPGSKAFERYENIYEIIKQKSRVVDAYDIDAGMPEFRQEYIQKELSVEINEGRIKELKQKIKDGEDVGASKREVKKLEEANKIFQESIDTLMDRADISFETKLKAEVASAKVLAESLGKTIKTYTGKEWKEKGFEEAEGSYNPKTGEMSLNLDVIRETRNLGAPIHEVIHHVLRNSLKGKDGKISQKGIEIIDGLMQKFSKKERKIIQKRIDDNYRYDVTGKEKDKGDYYEEYITGIGDAIKNKQIKYDQSKFRKIGKLVYPILGPLMPKLYKGVLSGTSSARATKDLYNMLGDIHLSSSSKRVKEGLKQLSETTGAEGKAVVETVSKSLNKSTSKFKGPVNKIGEKIDGKKFTTEDALIELYGKDGGVLAQLVRTKLKPFEKLPQFSYEDMVSETIMESMAHIRGFKPEMKIEGTEFGLYGWIESQLRNKINRVLGTGKATKLKHDIVIGSEEVRDIEDTGPTAEEMFDAKLKRDAIIKSAPNLRKSLINEKGEPYITDNITKAVENAVIKTLSQKLPSISTKDFQMELGKQYDAFLRDKVVEMMGKGETFDLFLETASPSVFKYMPKETLEQMERLVHSKKMLANYPNAEKIFTTKKRITKPTEVDVLVAEGLLPKDVSRTSGPNLTTKGEFPGIRKIMAFYRGKYKDPITGKEESMLDILGYEVTEAQLNNRKSKMGGSIGAEMAFDMTMQTAKLPEVKERRRLIENTTSEQAQIEIAEMAKRIDRDPDVKYSQNIAEISKEKLPTEKEQKAIEKAEKLKDKAVKYFKVERSAQEQMMWLMNEVRVRTRDGVFDKKGKLLSIYKDTKLTKGAVDMVLHLDNEGRIYPEPHKIEIAEQHKYIQGLESGVRSGVFETIPIQYGLLLGKPHGLKMLTDKVTEGGYPDFHSLIHDNPFNVEVKMFDSQLPRNAVGETLNFMTGKHSFKGGDSYNAQMQSMLAEGAAARKKWADFVLKEMQAQEINIKEITNKTQVPKDIYLKAQELGLQAKTEVTKPFKNGLDYIRDKYLAKKLKDGTEVSNHYIEIQSISGKELGLYKISDFNPLNLNVPKLDAKVNLKLRFSASSTNPVKPPKGYEKFHKAGQKYYSASMTFIPSMNMHSITKSSPYSISIRSKFLKMLKSPELAKLKELNPKEVTEKITKQIQNVLGPNYKMSKSSKKEIIKDMRTIDKAINLGRLIGKKKKGMSAWDFDDTLARTKSGVRYTSPNPSGKPAPKKKVIFMAGGPGSGKSTVIKGLKLEKQGFKIVNQDISLEWLMENHGLPKDMRDFTSEQASKFGSLGWDARMIAKRKQAKFQGKGDGIIVDGTGNSLNVMRNQVQEFKNKGYDVQMMFVETSLNTALKRNQARPERSLKDAIVERTHGSVQKNKEAFKELFGENFAEVKTDNLKQKDPMPADVVAKLDAFTKGYKKGRLSAEEFANEGERILEEGGEFDFAEFDYVKDGKQGPLFGEAMKRAKKFGLKDQFVITARPHAAKVAIFRFLDAQGLKIPFENIITLENSAAEAKAMWMLKKFEEGYNDMYFADDAMQNVKAVKDVLDQLDAKSRVQLAKRGEDIKTQSTESVKDTDRLSSPENYDNIKYSKNHRAEYEKTISKHRPDLVKEGLVSKTIDNMFTFVDNLKVAEGKKRKYEQITTKWLATSNIKLKEDAYKIKQAVDIAERYKEDIFSYRNPNELIEKYAGKVKEKFVSPSNVKEFKSSGDYKKRGLTTYDVENTKEGQKAVRDIIDSHWGENSNPWCITQAKNGKLTEDAWQNWTVYDKGPKRIIFQDGKLSSFYANRQYWDRMDNATDGPPIVVKEGRVTKKVELVEMGEGKFDEFVMETRTISKDNKTATTEHFVDKPLDPEGYTIQPAGTKIVERRVNGQTTRETTYRPNGDLKKITNFKDGKAIQTRTLRKTVTTSINNETRIDVEKHGDRINHEIREGKTDYWFGEISMEAQGIKDAKSDHQEWIQGVAKNMFPIGFQTKAGFEVMDIMKRVDGKLRVDVQKLLKIDPNAKGLPREDASQYKFSMNKKNLSKDFNKILEEVKGIGRKKTFSEAKGGLIGAKKGKYKIFGTPGMEDFSGLVTYAFAGKGKQGEAHKKFFDENLQKPFNRAYNDIHSRKQNISTDYKALRKAMPKVRKRLSDKVDGVYTVDQAVRVYLWERAGMEIPGLSKKDLKTLTDYVRKDGELTLFAEQLSQMTMLPEGYLKPADYWLGENITMDMNNVVDRVYRKEALSEFVENREAIFGKWQGGKIVGENMNKIESAYGPKHREALENMLWRMENMTNRTVGADSNTNKWMNWVNSATGTIMFFNQKSAALQTISSLNYVNGTFNNPMRAAQAFANLPQYYKDFVTIFNSDMMLQRRSGLKINIEAAELMERVGGGENGFAKFRAYILEKGFIPTKYADSFAIASGGATFYRNSIRKYKKQGLSEKEAEGKAWEDFTEMTEATQQSSRPDLISMQQASAIGRPILSFANTPMQMFRRHKRRIQDIANNRGNKAENIASALYYGFAQTMIFSYLANAMFAVDDESDDPEDIAFAEKQKSRYVNTITDSYLRGMGTGGAGVAALKNGILRFSHENKKDYNADYANVVIDMLNVSPPIGSKARKLYSAGKTWKYNKDVIPEMGFRLDNPAVLAVANVISATTNMPTDRAVMKAKNIKDASNSDFETWQRIAMLWGLNKWSLGVKDEELEAEMDAIKERVKKEKRLKKKNKSKSKKKIIRKGPRITF